MSCEQTLAGSEQSVKKSKIAKVHFILKKVRNSLFGKYFKLQISVEIQKSKMSYRRRCLVLEKKKKDKKILSTIKGYISEICVLSTK